MDQRNLDTNFSKVRRVGRCRDRVLEPERIRSSHRKFMALVTCLVICYGCGSEHPQNKPAEQAAAVKVHVATATQGQRSQVQRLPGTVRAVRSAPIAGKLTGTIL